MKRLLCLTAGVLLISSMTLSGCSSEAGYRNGLNGLGSTESISSASGTNASSESFTNDAKLSESNEDSLTQKEGITEESVATREGSSIANSEKKNKDNVVSSESLYRISTEVKNDSEVADDGETLAEVSYELLHYLAEDSNEDSGNISLDGINKALETVNSDTEQMSASFAKDERANAEKDFAEQGQEYFATYSEKNTLEVFRADSEILSMLREDYRYLGGAHGFSSSSAYTFDAQTGRQLKFSEIMNASSEELSKALADELIKQYGEESFDTFTGVSLSECIKRLLDGDDNYKGKNDLHYVTWYLTDNGVTFVFDEYLIGPFSAGKFFVTLTPSDYQSYFKTPDLFLH